MIGTQRAEGFAWRAIENVEMPAEIAQLRRQGVNVGQEHRPTERPYRIQNPPVEGDDGGDFAVIGGGSRKGRVCFEA